MWSPDPSIIVTAEQKAAEASAAARLLQFPNLEPDEFWFIVRVTGHEQQLREWVANLNEPGTEAVPNPYYSIFEWAQASSKIDFGKHFERDHPFVEAARMALGLEPAELDSLWAYGGGV